MVHPNSSAGNALEEERQELAALLAYPEIARSANLVRLLSFVCEKYFDGKSDEIRESSIAIQALGRKGTDFDSHADPIVRVTARTLRKRLDVYYNHEGRNRPLRLVLPVGQYVPKFIPWSAALGLHDPSLHLDPEPQDESSSLLHPSISHPAAEKEPARSAAAVPAAAQTRSSLSRKRILAWIAFAGVIVAACATSFWFGRRSTMRSTEVPSNAVLWGTPVWSDEFSGPEGEPLDPSSWAFDVGQGSAFGNGEMVTYCAPGASTPSACDPHRPNALKDGAGHLVIRAIKARSGSWSSARIKTQGLREFQYGRIEARMKLPVGAGLWPAFWMLGSSFSKVGWPESGSVDFLENVSTPNRPSSLGPNMIRSTVHGPGYSAGNGLWQNYILQGSGRIDDDSFHTYGAIWSPNMIQFYVDDPSNIFFVKTASDAPAGADWVLNNKFFLILDLALGGEWPGPPDDTTPDPSIMLVDYVRVYKAMQVPGPRISASPIVTKSGSFASTTVELAMKPGSGRVYLSCSGAPANSTCSLASPVVDFSTSGIQQDSLKLQTELISGPGRFLTPPGNYVLTITATTVSGDTSSINIPLQIEQ